MKGTSKVIMGATLVMVVSLAVVLGLILVLLAELYCSLLLRRRQLRNTNSATIPTAFQTATTRANVSPSQALHPQEQSPPSLFSGIYAHGVLQAPKSFFFPEAASNEGGGDPKQQLSELSHIIQIQTQEFNASPHQIGLLSGSSPPTKLKSKIPTKSIQAAPHEDSTSSTVCLDKSCSGGEHLMYISNPIYENDDGSKPSGSNTPFETPGTSPSRLERSGSSGDDEVAQPQASTQSPAYTPPLTPMKKLPAEASSVSLRDARSLGTSGSDSYGNNGLSSSSSGSPCTSPSW